MSTKCLTCKRKLKLVETIHGLCRCKQLFCSHHLLNHNCEFDYKTMEQERIMKDNPQLTSKKLTKI